MTMMALVGIAFRSRAALALALCSCRTSAPPSPGWVHSGPHSRYHEDQFVLGVGSASQTSEKAATRADANARAEIAKQIQVRVHDLFTSNEWQERRGTNVQTGQSVEHLSVEQVDITLEGVQIAERYSSPDQAL